jgi:hypothetical protein
MSDRERCQPQMLAHEGWVRVDLCGCGQVHVSIGPFTVRLAPAQYRTLSDTLQAATARLSTPGQALPLH